MQRSETVVSSESKAVVVLISKESDILNVRMHLIVEAPEAIDQLFLEFPITGS